MAEDERNIQVHLHSSSASRTSNAHSGPSLLSKKSGKSKQSGSREKEKEKEKEKQKERKDKGLGGDKGYVQFEAEDDPFPADLGSFRSHADQQRGRDRSPKSGKSGKPSFKLGKGVSDKPKKETEKIKSSQQTSHQQTFSPAGEEISSVEHSEGASSSFGASSFFTFAPTRAGGGGGGSGATGGGGGERDVAVSAAAGDERALFGVPLAVAVARSPSHDGIRVPLFMRLCLYFLEQNGLKSEGIYRVSGLKSKITALRNAIQQTPADAQQVERALAEYSEYAVSGVIKQFFKELPESLLTDALTPAFEATCGIAETQARTAELKKLLAQLPSCNYMTLAMLVLHMLHIIANQKTNRMNLQNLSIVLSPSLRISHRVLSVLLAGPAIVVRELFPAHEQLSPARPYAPPVSVRAAVGATSARLTLDLPDTLPLIEAELIRQNSVLAHLHRLIAARSDTPTSHDASARSRGARKGSALLKLKDSRAAAAPTASAPGDPADEHLVELWEVQKLITALKRKRQLLSLATSEAIDAELQKLAANLEKLHEDVKSHNTTHEPLSPSTGGALAQGPASLSPSSTSNTSASTTAVLGTSPTPGAGATSGDAKKDAAECAECKQLQDELWALQCTITMLKRRMKRAKKGELNDEVRSAEQLRRMQETAFGQRLLAPLPPPLPQSSSTEPLGAKPAPAPKQTDIDEEVELNLELATPAAAPSGAADQQLQQTPPKSATEVTTAPSVGSAEATRDTPPAQALPDASVSDRRPTRDAPKVAVSASASVTAHSDSMVFNLSISSVSKANSSGGVTETTTTALKQATIAHPASALPATEPLPESTAEAPHGPSASASEAVAAVTPARPRASSAESLSKKSPQRTLVPTHHRSTDAALAATVSPPVEQQTALATARQPADAPLVSDMHLSASTRLPESNTTASASAVEAVGDVREREAAASDDDSDNSDAGDEGDDVERTRLPDAGEQESDADVHSESLASFMEASALCV